jgi:lipopolysaccharide transport system ATP-binding protein
MCDPLIYCSAIGKKFCRSMKRSLVYGMKDIAATVVGSDRGNVQLREGEFWAVRDISFDIGRGDCLGIIGGNGAGKSTLLKLLNGIIRPDNGRVEINGRASALIEVGAGFHPMLTGRENIYIGGAILGMTTNEINAKYKDIVEFSGCEEFIDTPVKYYSSGMYARLGFAIAIHVKPDILIIDEILSVGDSSFRAKCFNEIYKLVEDTAIIFVSHNMPDLSRICNKILVMHEGESVYQGDDIARGINIYQSSLVRNEPVVFNPKAALKNISVTSDDGTKVDSISYGSFMRIAFDMRTDSAYEKVDINIIITGPNLQNIMQYNTAHRGESISNRGNPIGLEFEMGQIYLNPGQYSISIGITSENHGEVLARYTNIIVFQVKGDAFGYAPLQLPLECRIRDGC